MGIWYVKRRESKASLLEELFHKIIIKQVENRIVVELPVNDNKIIDENLQKKLAEKLAKKMYDKPNQNLVLASNLELETFKNTLYSNNCSILNGRWMFKYLVYKVIEYIAEKQETEVNKLNIALITNDNSSNMLKIIIKIAQNVKALNIITSDIDKFEYLQKYLLENMGIVIRTTNNRKKALLKSNLIINMDFSEDAFNQYAIPKRAVVVNITDKVNIKSKRFDGINANFYKVKLCEENRKWLEENELLGRFDESILLESIQYSKSSFEAIEKVCENTQIEYLIGNNGKIEDEEYTRIVNE